MNPSVESQEVWVGQLRRLGRDPKDTLWNIIGEVVKIEGGVYMVKWSDSPDLYHYRIQGVMSYILAESDNVKQILKRYE